MRSDDCGRDWRHHAFLTDLDGDAVDVDKFHRHHAVVELAIRDSKESAGLEHVPSGNFTRTAAWLQCAVLAHNLIRWTTMLGGVRVDQQLIVARTIRTRLLAIPARLVNRAGKLTLRLPTRWPSEKSSREPSTRCDSSDQHPASGSRGQARAEPIERHQPQSLTSLDPRAPTRSRPPQRLHTKISSTLTPPDHQSVDPGSIV